MILKYDDVNDDDDDDGDNHDNDDEYHADNVIAPTVFL